ncbi:MAG: V-type ATPase 116kDa subunit family protein [Candidatus Bathyarchaeia archaeon]
MLTAERMSLVRIYVYKPYIEEVIFSLGEAKVLHPIDIRQHLHEFDGKIQPVEAGERAFRLSSLLSRIQTLLMEVNLEEIEFSKEVKKFLTDEDILRIDEEITAIESEYSKLVSEVKPEMMDLSLKEKFAKELLVKKEVVEIAKLMDEIKSKMGMTKKTFVLEGWVPTKRINELKDIVDRASSGYCSIVEVKSKESSDEGGGVFPPTLSKTPSFAKVFERITTSFGNPSYFEINPSLIMAISFPIIFGLMFGDVGHGLMLFFASLLIYALRRRKLKLGEFFDYLTLGAPLLLACSLSSIFFGFLYEEIFGSEEYFKVLENWINLSLGVSIHDSTKYFSKSLESFLSKIFGFKIRVPFPFSPFHEPTLMLLLSIYVATIHISSGLVLGTLNKLINKEFKEAISGPGVWLFFYLNFSYLLLKYRSRVFTVVFERMDIVVMNLILPLAIMLGVKLLVHRTEGFGEGLEALISSLSNTISYGRILALALAHGAFSKVLLMFLELGGGIMRILGIAIWGFITLLLIIVFEGLLSFIHTLRLHWVEWFLKFYSGNGVPYQPFAFSRKYTFV